MDDRLRVLIVDDNEDLSEVMSEFLGESGYMTRVASSGARGLDIAAAFAPHIVLLDLGLPDITGYEFMERFRAQPANSAVQVIAVSGYGSDEAKSRCRELGISHYLVKPVEFDTVLKLLTTVSSSLRR